MIFEDVFDSVFNTIINYEVKFILYIQYIFGGPEKNVGLIKFCKLFTNDKIQKKIFVYSLALKIIIDITIYGFQIMMFCNTFKNFIKLYLLHKISKIINYNIKSFLQIRRPYINHTNIENVTIKKDKSKSYSFPSNSVQNTYIFYYSLLNMVFDNYSYNIYITGILITIVALI